VDLSETAHRKTQSPRKFGKGMSRAQKAAQKAAVSVLRDWNEPHGAGHIMDSRWMHGMEADVSGNIRLTLTPSRPHCPCCLINLSDLRNSLLAKRAVKGAHIEVTNVPDAHRWTNVINQ
jgi:hypothetical protein